MQQIIRGQKSFLVLGDVREIKVPIRPELSVANTWADAIDLPGVQDHFPAEWEDARRVDRKFYWTILATLHGEYVRALIRGSREARREYHEQRNVPRQMLLPQPDWI